MNDSGENQQMLNLQRSIDQLVDGELTSSRQRQVLRLLDAQSDGWRRCALAFIEGQTWRREFREAVEPREPSRAVDLGAAKSQEPSHRRRFPRRALHWASIATGLIATFMLGAVSKGLWLPTSMQHPQDAAESLATSADVQPNPQRAGAVESAANTSHGKLKSLEMTIASSDGQKKQTIEVPLVEADEKNWQSVLAGAQSVLSNDALQALELTGHQVEKHRAYYPVQLHDGRQAVVPMDYLDVKSNVAWQ